MENQKNVNNKIAENCSKDSLELIEKAFRNLKNDKINTYVISIDGDKLDFIDNPPINIIEQYKAEARAGMFFNTHLLLEIMNKNGIQRSIDGKSIEDLQTFANKIIKEDEYSINKHAEMAGTLREVAHELRKNNSKNLIVIFLRNMNISVLQEEINDYISSQISSNLYDLRLFSDNKLCTHKNIFRREITSPQDFVNIDLSTDEAVTEYIQRIKGEVPEQSSNSKPSIRH